MPLTITIVELSVLDGWFPCNPSPVTESTSWQITKAIKKESLQKVRRSFNHLTPRFPKTCLFFSSKNVLISRSFHVSPVVTFFLNVIKVIIVSSAHRICNPVSNWLWTFIVVWQEPYAVYAASIHQNRCLVKIKHKFHSIRGLIQIMFPKEPI